jgi:hypothetical protein
VASQGPLIVTAGADDATVGTVAWVTPGNITADDAAYATATLTSGTSHYLKGTNPAFTIPAGATIDGIVVEWKRKIVTGDTGAVNDSSVKLVLGGTIQGTDKSAGAAWSATEGWVSFGSSSDKWGLTPTVAQVNASDFGAVLSCVGNASNNWKPNVNACRITVYYTAAAADVLMAQICL